ncbi:MAG: hypothetical protein HC810_01825 [Acaryochloridaceae cyanobacterium RL_2_7]|nr:hypothetical protein [Acaryochloridaceae cyanobacterium RL_2_7]
MRFNPIQNAFLAMDPSLLAEGSILVGTDPYLSWKAAIEAMGQVLTQYCSDVASISAAPSSEIWSSFRGLVFCGPTPVMHQSAVQVHFQTCLWLPQLWARTTPQLLPGQNATASQEPEEESIIPLPESDPLLLEQFCVVLTQEFSWAATLSHTAEGDQPFLP